MEKSRETFIIFNRINFCVSGKVLQYTGGRNAMFKLHAWD